MSYTDIAVSAGVQVHTPFLERASQPGNAERAHALGAFLALRAVDRMAETTRPSLADGVAFQLRAAANYLDDLHPQTKDVSHLREIVRVAFCAVQAENRTLLWAPLLAFAYWLENELRINESLDVLDTALRFNDGAEVDQVAAHLQRGRVLRTAGRFVDARDAYACGGSIARRIGDFRSEMVSRIGSAWVVLKTGDLPSAEGELREVLAQSRIKGDTFVEARALHDLAAVTFYAGRATQAVPMAFKAFELYDEPLQRARALTDLGAFLKELGHYSAAKEAFLLVLDSPSEGDVRTNAKLELMELSAVVQDRFSFERWRKELDANYEKLPPAERVDFQIKLGVGVAAFGNVNDGLDKLARAMDMAEQYKLGRSIFEAERLAHEIREGRNVYTETMPPSREELEPELRETISSLCAVRG